MKSGQLATGEMPLRFAGGLILARECILAWMILHNFSDIVINAFA